jgi:hypothetical protein
MARELFQFDAEDYALPDIDPENVVEDDEPVTWEDYDGDDFYDVVPVNPFDGSTYEEWE